MLGWIFLQCLLSQSRTKLGSELECERGVHRRRWLLATVDKLGGWKCQRGVSGAVPGEKLSFLTLSCSGVPCDLLTCPWVHLSSFWLSGGLTHPSFAACSLLGKAMDSIRDRCVLSSKKNSVFFKGRGFIEFINCYFSCKDLHRKFYIPPFKAGLKFIGLKAIGRIFISTEGLVLASIC